MKSFTVYCLLLCIIVILVVHQTNAVPLELESFVETRSASDFRNDSKLTSFDRELTTETSKSDADVIRHSRRNDQNCGNGNVQIVNGQLSCSQE